MDIKEESCLLDFCSENEGDTKDLVKKIKIETITSSSDIKPEVEDSPCCSQNEEYHLLRFNETIKESEIETKINIKEEHWWLIREESCINEDIKDEAHEDCYSTKLPSLCKEDVSTYKSEFFSSEHLEDDVSFNTNKVRPERISDRKCQSQKNVPTDISSIETSLCSETSDHAKIVTMASSLKHSNLLQQSSTNEQHINNKNCKSIASDECRKSYNCNVSEKCFKCSPHLKKCKLVLESKKVDKCDVSTKGLNQLSLKTRKLTDDAQKPHKCNICNKSFARLQRLKTHKLNHEGIKPHKCNICNRAFNEVSRLKTHILIHEGIKPHKCNICNKAFTQSSDYKRHKLIHEGKKPHKCNICNKTFTQLSDLKRHKLIHQGIKPHKCNTCNKAFTHLSDLNRHKLTHEGIKPHKCNICNKDFTRSSILKTHKLIHEGIKPHKCNDCYRAFTKLSSLKTHKLIHEGIKPHKCSICNKAFTILSYLKRHMLIHEDNQPQ